MTLDYILPQMVTHFKNLLTSAEDRAIAAESSAKSTIAQAHKEVVKTKQQHEKAMKLVAETEAKAVEARRAHEEALADVVKTAKTSTMITLLQARLKMVKEARDLGLVNPKWKHEAWVKKLKELGGDVPAGFEVEENVEGSGKGEAQKEKTQDAGSQEKDAMDVGDDGEAKEATVEGSDAGAEAAATGTVQ